LIRVRRRNTEQQQKPVGEMKLLIESTTVLEGPPTESFKVLLKVMGILFSISECACEQTTKTLFTKQ